MPEYIDREAANEICATEYQERLRMLDYCGDTVAWNIGHAIKSLPAADVTPVVHGRWIKDGNFLACTACEAEMDIKNSLGAENHKNYCPNCGAKMDGEP